MKLRNKKTGEIGRLYFDHQLIDPKTGTYAIVIQHRDKLGYEAFANYFTLAELNAEWEDYKSAEPLIKDKTTRGAIKAWADANLILGNEKVEVSTPTVDCTILTLTYGMTSIDIMINEEITLKNHGRYTIDELCGEEAPEPLEPSFIDLDERIREKASEKLYKGENDIHLTEEEE